MSTCRKRMELASNPPSLEVQDVLSLTLYYTEISTQIELNHRKPAAQTPQLIKALGRVFLSLTGVQVFTNSATDIFNNYSIHLSIYNGKYSHQANQKTSQFLLYPVGKPHGKAVIRSLPVGPRNTKLKVLQFECIMISDSQTLY